MRRRGEGVSLLKETLDVEVEVTVGAAADAATGEPEPAAEVADGRAGAGGRSGGTEPAAASPRRRPAPARSRAELTASAAGGRDAAVRGLTRLGAALRRDRTELLAAAVLALAVLAALTSWGALDIAGAATEPAPIVWGSLGD